MQSDWPTVPLESVTVNYDTKRKPVKEADRRPGPFPYYGASGVVDHVDGFLFDGEYLLIAEDGENLRTRNTPIAFRATGRFWVNNHAHIVQGNERARTRFLEYAILAADIAPFLTGAVMPKLTQGNLNKIPVACPPLEVQDAVIEILGRIDDRIDLLRQTNTTLESIAQALFKSWFIDFDPVRAKAEGREPECMDAATAALFPAEFQESALGLIPKRWQPATLADAMHLNPARSLSKGISAPYLEMANAPTAGHRPLELVAQRAFGSGCKFTNGDALLAKITPCLENGKSAFVDFLAEDQVGWGSTEFIVMRSKPVLPDYCAYLLARYEPFRQFAIQSMTGTSGRQRVELSRLAQFPMALPPDSTIASAVAPMFCSLQSRIAANDEVAQSLSSLRDTLLPRLISGKLRLPEAQEQLEGALA